MKKFHYLNNFRITLIFIKFFSKIAIKESTCNASCLTVDFNLFSQVKEMAFRLSTVIYNFSICVK